MRLKFVACVGELMVNGNGKFESTSFPPLSEYYYYIIIWKEKSPHLFPYLPNYDKSINKNYSKLSSNKCLNVGVYMRIILYEHITLL